ncbi:hypothetical protein LRS10_05930 [Phenylobacterium sp. J426]|uniref:hypothetical protein n=1 Tax=Phenylobacterium sp. J426 TaxID=2898439 RepID=UPI002150FFD3|nr:hypothetical protein [Phenylobacterium sp. J426]MCR5873755.1 hypothetical protein [Phenylobacterium sp. J426]
MPAGLGGGVGATAATSTGTGVLTVSSAVRVTGCIGPRSRPSGAEVGLGEHAEQQAQAKSDANPAQQHAAGDPAPRLRQAVFVGLELPSLGARLMVRRGPLDPEAGIRPSRP